MSYNIPQFNVLAMIGPRRGQDNMWLIHQRLGHPLLQILKCMFPNVFKGISIENLICDVCERAKYKRHSYKSHHSKRRKQPFQLIHYDVWGLAPFTYLHGFKWFLILVDDFSIFTLINLLQHKSDVTMKVKQYIQMIDQQFE